MRDGDCHVISIAIARRMHMQELEGEARAITDHDHHCSCRKKLEGPLLDQEGGPPPLAFRLLSVASRHILKNGIPSRGSYTCAHVHVLTHK